MQNYWNLQHFTLGWKIDEQWFDTFFWGWDQIENNAIERIVNTVCSVLKLCLLSFLLHQMLPSEINFTKTIPWCFYKWISSRSIVIKSSQNVIWWEIRHSHFSAFLAFLFFHGLLTHMAKSLILCGPNQNLNPKWIFGIWI